MNNEPIAYIPNTGLKTLQDGSWCVANAVKMEDSDIPLYTHPVKELTDEEILECWNETHPAVVCLNAELPLFARAILRKAQEK